MSSEQKTRTFTKEVDGETVTRQVTSPSAEVEALFEGYTEQTSGSKPTGGSSSSRSASSSS